MDRSPVPQATSRTMSVVFRFDSLTVFLRQTWSCQSECRRLLMSYEGAIASNICSTRAALSTTLCGLSRFLFDQTCGFGWLTLWMPLCGCKCGE